VSQINDSKAELVRSLIEQAPDSAIRRLLLALSADGGHDDGLNRVQLMVEAEAGDRQARNFAFAPIAPLCAPPGPFTGLSFPPRALTLIWRAVKQEAGPLTDAARSLAYDWRTLESSPEVFDRLCALAAQGLRDRHGPFAAAAAAADQGGGAETLAACLDIAAVARRALEQMPEWLGRMSSDKSARLRLAYRDAVAVSDDAGPRFFEMLAAHLTEPWLILRVISGIMDRPNEAYLAGSELGGFAERVLADIDRQLDIIAAFRPAAGRQAAHAAASAVHRMTVEAAELEQSVHLAPDGPWGRRLAKQKQDIAAIIDGHLKGADRAVAQALPLQTVRIGPRVLRGVPRLTHPPDDEMVARAETVLAFMAAIRPSAAAGGFASTRAKALEEVEARLDDYVQHVLDDIRADDGVDPDRARAFLEVAARLCGLARDEEAAKIIRRRAAAA
jgi:hypothetical protein